MKLSIIIPAYNEEEHLADCLSSFVSQTLLPDELIIADDNSTDDTFLIAQEFSEKYSWIKVYKNNTESLHMPGSKVINNFYFGLSHSEGNYDLLGKFDADLLLPPNYFDEIKNYFQKFPNLGMCAGNVYVQNENLEWVHEKISDKEHIRGPVKLYSAECFKKIGGLKASIGWDTVDELLAKYYGFRTLTIPSLKVKHLRPTGKSYNSKSRKIQGEALYRMRYGFKLAFLSALKMSVNYKDPKILQEYMSGYFKAEKQKQPFLVSEEEGRFIRKFRWKNIRKKLF
ncbi:glycosyltransferase family A protein [Salegentibacter sp. F188]|uniref:Glycosyltransferase family A protein n=1 Tax=Autumnicola patrickiae TaxID=3075591 RepID=A0ABU3E011_9FLAO|nr:glycosyltransferase family A protein [Salegentibacter sp. F188]MDT0689218.1 glycosyltransferase family A protein [Salegentibacter sp. F188]